MAQKKNEMGLMPLGLCSIMVGVMATSWGGLAGLGLACNALGVGSIVYGVTAGKRSRAEMFFEATSLYVTVNSKKKFPQIKEIKETPYGENVKIFIPDGLSSDEFRKNATSIKEFFRAEKIEIGFNNGFVFIKLYKNKLPLDCPYEKDIKTKGLLIPIGYSYDGVEFIDLEKAPHLGIYGTTGGGKSTILRTIITFLMANKPFVKFHLIDLKNGLELRYFTQSKSVKSFAKNAQEGLKVLQTVKKELDKRLELFEKHNVKDITAYNNKFPKNKLDFEVVVIDEFADFYFNKQKETFILMEELISKSRAVGIHFLISTQRPSAEVITGIIKAQVNAIIGLKTANRINSGVVIGIDGLDGLRGEGHAIIKTEKNELKEIQCFNLEVEESEELIKSASKEIKPKPKIISADFEKKKPKSGVYDDLSILKKGLKKNDY